MIKLDTRYFSRLAYDGLKEVETAVKQDPPNGADTQFREDLGKASSAVQGLPAYLAAWGLHRLIGDYAKYKIRGGKTKYRAHVYQQFLQTLKQLSPVDFDPDDPTTLIHKPSLHDYTGLNRLAIALAQEWSFWAVSVLGEAKEE
jgi:hypothetical protein